MPFLHKSFPIHKFNKHVCPGTAYIKSFKFFRKENDRKQDATPSIRSDNSYTTKSNLQKWRSFPFFTASITIEAAIVLPMMLFMILMLLFPIKLMEAERRLQNTMEGTAKSLCIAEYVRETGKSYISTEGSDSLMNTFMGFEKGTAMAAVLLAADTDKMEDIAFAEDTSVLTDDDESDPAMVFMKLSYKLKFPEVPFIMPDVRKELVVNRRVWIGSDGGRGRSKYGEALDEDEENPDRIVYLGKTSSEVYHEDPNCHYLSNKLSVADAPCMESLRNAGGGKYHACPSCKPGKSGTVYYFESGSAYHSSESCKAITAYSRTARLSELSGMRACSYCGKKAHNTKETEDA